jgi:4-hydroxy-4-methyl-2-oxoglutarate aldolase
MRSDKEMADRLVALGVATLHEVLGRRHLLTGLRLLVGEPFAGPALTVAIPAGDNLGLHLALEAAQPGSVICGASVGGGLYGVLGEILHEAGRVRGVVGFAIDDGIRDFAHLNPPPSVAARGVSPRGTVKRRLRQPVGSDVPLGGTLVATGDWIICDRDGLCAIPERELQDTISRAESRLAAEHQAREQVDAGASTRSVLELTTHPPTSSV